MRDRALLLLVSAALAWMFQVHLRVSHVDYNTFHEAGARVLGGDLANLYSHRPSSMGGFLYPLGAAWFFTGFEVLGEWPGRLAFYLLLAACLIGILRWTSREFPAGPHSSRALWITLLLGSRSINDSWISGNVSLLLLALAILSFHFYARSRTRLDLHLSAACFGLAASLKLFPLAAGAFWAWRRDLRHLLRFTCWTAGLYIAPYLLLGAWDGTFERSAHLLGQWFSVLRDPANFGSNEMIHFQNLTTALHRLASSLELGRGWITPLVGLLALLFTLIPALRRRHANSPAQDTFDFAVVLAWVPLFSPVTWHHVGVFYLPLIHATAAETVREGRLRRSLPLWSFFILYTLTGKNVLGTGLHASISQHSIPLLGVLALVLPATRRSFRRASAPA